MRRPRLEGVDAQGVPGLGNDIGNVQILAWKLLQCETLPSGQSHGVALPPRHHVARLQLLDTDLRRRVRLLRFKFRQRAGIVEDLVGRLLVRARNGGATRE